MADDQYIDFGDTGRTPPNPTGQGVTLTGSDVAMTEGVALPPRPVRAAANNASRLEGVQEIPDTAMMGDTDMKGNEPWR